MNVETVRKRTTDEQDMATALGLESAYGYHLEEEPRLPAVSCAPERHAGQWYPCLDSSHVYSGCRGEACPLETCWTGGASTSYAAALRRRFHPTDVDYAAGARCLGCAEVREVRIPVIGAGGKVIRLCLLECGRAGWQHAISVAAFVRRRIPAPENEDLAECPLYVAAAGPLAPVASHRQQINEQARARRAARCREHAPREVIS
jgi:hypothetical protein